MLEVVLTTVIPCSEVSLFLIFTGSKVFKTALLESWLILLSTNILLCKKVSSLVTYQASLCFQDDSIGVQVST